MKYEDISGYVGIYKAGDDGTILSVEKNETLTPVDNGLGYLQVGLYKNGVRTRFYVHVLVYEAHRGKIPKNKEIGHNDDIRSHNWLSNLYLTTRKQNMRKMLEKKRGKLNADKNRKYS